MIEPMAAAATIMSITTIWYLMAVSGSEPARIWPVIMPGRETRPTVIRALMEGIMPALMTSRRMVVGGFLVGCAQAEGEFDLIALCLRRSEKRRSRAMVMAFMELPMIMPPRGMKYWGVYQGLAWTMAAVTRMETSGVADDHRNEGGNEEGDGSFSCTRDADGVRGPEDHPYEEDENQVRVVDLKDVLEDVADQEELREGAHRAPREVLFQVQPEDDRARARNQDEYETQQQLHREISIRFIRRPPADRRRAGNAAPGSAPA